MKYIKNITLFLSMLIFFCNENNKMTGECKYGAEEFLRFFMCQESEDCVDKALTGYKIEDNLKVESANSEISLAQGQYGPTYQFKYTTLLKPTGGTRYKLYSTIPLPVNAGETYKIYNSYASPFPGGIEALSSSLKIYNSEGKLLFSSATNSKLDSFLDNEGISVEELSGICPVRDGIKNTALKFSCGEDSLVLYQTQEGLLNCNGNEFKIHVNIAWELDNKELPHDYPYTDPLFSFYIIRE